MYVPLLYNFILKMFLYNVSLYFKGGAGSSAASELKIATAIRVLFEGK